MGCLFLGMMRCVSVGHHGATASPFPVRRAAISKTGRFAAIGVSAGLGVPAASYLLRYGAARGIARRLFCARIGMYRVNALTKPRN
jgi:hypothetical protein